MISAAENFEGVKQPDRDAIFDAALAAYCTVNAICECENDSTGYDLVKTFAADLKCKPVVVLSDLEEINAAIRALRKRLVEGAP